MDIAQNSIRAGASCIGIAVEENLTKDELTITVEDDGCGMDEATLKRIRDPFFTSRTVRKVGLGIPLLQQNAERTGGDVDIRSLPGKGTVLKARFVHSHLDRPPLGNLAETICLLIAANPTIEFSFTRSSGKGSFGLDTRELKQMLEGTPLNDPEILNGVREMIEENEKEITEE